MNWSQSVRRQGIGVLDLFCVGNFPDGETATISLVSQGSTLTPSQPHRRHGCVEGTMQVFRRPPNRNFLSFAGGLILRLKATSPGSFQGVPVSGIQGRQAQDPIRPHARHIWLGCRRERTGRLSIVPLQKSTAAAVGPGILTVNGGSSGASGAGTRRHDPAGKGTGLGRWG
jgi:hypothetical protein